MHAHIHLNMILGFVFTQPNGNDPVVGINKNVINTYTHACTHTHVMEGLQRK